MSRAKTKKVILLVIGTIIIYSLALIFITFTNKGQGQAADSCMSYSPGAIIWNYCPDSVTPVSIRDGFEDCYCSNGPAQYEVYHGYVCTDCITGFMYEFDEIPAGNYVCLEKCWIRDVHANSDCSAEGGFCDCWYESAGSCFGDDAANCNINACKGAGYSETAYTQCGTPPHDTICTALGRPYYGTRSTDDCECIPTAFDCCVCCGAVGGLDCSLSGSPKSGYLPLTVNFLISAQGPPIEWRLDFGDGNSQCNEGHTCTSGRTNGNPNGLVINHTYTTMPNPAFSQYTAILTVWNASGNSVSKQVIIDPFLSPPQNVRHTANTPTSITWQWDPVFGATDYTVFSRAYDLFYPGALTGDDYALAANVPVTNYTQTDFYYFSTKLSLTGFIFNMENNLLVKACYRDGIFFECSGASALARAATSIEVPNLLTCPGAGKTSTSLTLEVNSNERTLNAGLQGFSYLDIENFGVDNNSVVEVKVETLGGSLLASQSFPIAPVSPGNPAVFNSANPPIVVPSPWNTGNVLSPSTSYRLCARSKNQNAVVGNSGDFRPSGADSCAPASRVGDWCCTTCDTLAAGPASVGYIKVYHSGLGVIKLNLISAAAAVAAGKGTIKVARFNGDVSSAAELVELNDAKASPVRVRTPVGIKSWARLP